MPLYNGRIRFWQMDELKARSRNNEFYGAYRIRRSGMPHFLRFSSAVYEDDDNIMYRLFQYPKRVIFI